MSAQLSRCVAVYSRHFVASRINAPAVVVAVVFTLDHFVTTQRTMGWTKSLLDRPTHGGLRHVDCTRYHRRNRLVYCKLAVLLYARHYGKQKKQRQE